MRRRFLSSLAGRFVRPNRLIMYTVATYLKCNIALKANVLKSKVALRVSPSLNALCYQYVNIKRLFVFLLSSVVSKLNVQMLK